MSVKALRFIMAVQAAAREQLGAERGSFTGTYVSPADRHEREKRLREGTPRDFELDIPHCEVNVETWTQQRRRRGLRPDVGDVGKGRC
jgi:hypothetical protein